jgi:hypothetical protein
MATLIIDQGSHFEFEFIYSYTLGGKIAKLTDDTLAPPK